MAKKQIFLSFHFDNDVMRVQQIRNIGVLEGNEPVSVNTWEEVKRKGKSSIEKWIDDNMKYRSCVVVLVGEETASRPWVKYEIKKAWEDGKGVFGIYIHNLKCPRNGKSTKGKNPFEQFTFDDGSKLSSIVNCYNPSQYDAYNDIANNMEKWVSSAVAQRK
ncbi:hypothetical protein [uncultured Gammaproteobacteria bacterium]|jgi:hypothetical protein|nr:hypothetical protein [uncultured Gammaproteobacteria bacterium]CAC9658433.1 hypothetical protein [uncultured Gammaproteobacteria bacterium]